MSFESFIARRLYGEQNHKRQRVSRSAIQIAIAGIAVGLITMVVSLAVVRGFKQEVSEKARGFLSDAQILSLTQDQFYNVLPVTANDSLLNVVKRIKGVSKVQIFASKSGMLKTEENFAALQFKGVDENYDATFLRNYLVEGNLPKFSAHKSSNEILLSARQCRDLGLKVGDKVTAYFFSTRIKMDEDGETTSSQDLRARRFTVCGIYETHLAQYDRNISFTDLHTIQRINHWEKDECSGIEIDMTAQANQDAVLHELIQKVNHRTMSNGARIGAFSIQELSPRIFAWLDVLDTNVVMIVVLMLVIGSFTVMSSLLIVMLERIHTIALLKALGSTDQQIRGIFQRFSLYVVGKSLLIGNAIAYCLCLLQEKFHLLPLNADTYYIDSVPISLTWTAFLLVNAGVLLISLLVIVGGSHLMSLGVPARSLRWD